MTTYTKPRVVEVRGLTCILYLNGWTYYCRVKNTKKYPTWSDIIMDFRDERSPDPNLSRPFPTLSEPDKKDEHQVKEMACGILFKRWEKEQERKKDEEFRARQFVLDL